MGAGWKIGFDRSLGDEAAITTCILPQDYPLSVKTALYQIKITFDTKIHYLTCQHK